jgi:hypothetical protein
MTDTVRTDNSAVIEALEADNKRLREAGQATIDYYNGDHSKGEPLGDLAAAIKGDKHA